MKYNSNGFGHVLILLAVVVLGFLGYLWYKSQQNPPTTNAFVSQEECEKETKKECAYTVCDYIPSGKSPEEVCKGIGKGWIATDRNISTSQIPKDNTENLDWVIYKNEEFGFSFKYPVDWPSPQEEEIADNSDLQYTQINFGDMLTVYARDGRHSTPYTLERYESLSIASNTTLEEVSTEKYKAFKLTELNGDTGVDISESLTSVKIISLWYNNQNSPEKEFLYDQILTTFEFSPVISDLQTCLDEAIETKRDSCKEAGITPDQNGNCVGLDFVNDPTQRCYNKYQQER